MLLLACAHPVDWLEDGMLLLVCAHPVHWWIELLSPYLNPPVHVLTLLTVLHRYNVYSQSMWLSF